MFFFLDYVRVQDTKDVEENTENTLMELTKEKSDNISLTLSRIQAENENISEWMAQFIDADVSDKLNEEYTKRSDGTIIRKSKGRENLPSSNIFVSTKNKDEKTIIEDINRTELVDDQLHNLIYNEPIIKWTYIVTKSNLLRVSPFFSMDAFEEGHSQIEDVFYQDVINNEGDSVWTKPYEDYLGSGLVITCSKSIKDKDNKIYGVACADINISSFKNMFFANSQLGDTGDLIIVDDIGNIIYHPKYEASDLDKGVVFSKSIYDEYDNEGDKNAIKKAISKEGFYKSTNVGNDKIITSNRIENTPMILLMVVDKESYLSNKTLGNDVFNVYIVFDLFVLLLLVFILYIKFSRPMNKIIGSAEKISEGDFDIINEISTNNLSGFSEINQLQSAFISMNNSMNKYILELLEKNNEISSIINTMNSSIIVIDENKDILIMNEETKKRSTYSEKEKKCYKLLYNRDKRCEDCIYENIVESKKICETNNIINNRYYRNVYYPIIDSIDNVKKIVIVSEDYTERLIVKKSLQQSEKMAGIGQLATSIAHELKNPLQTMKGALYVLEYNDSNKNAEEIKSIKNAILESEKVIDTLLDFSGINNKTNKEVNIVKIIDEVILLTRKDRIKHGIDISKDVDIGNFKINGNIEVIKIAVQNLVINAIHAVDNGGEIKIKVKNSKGKIYISVIDNGKGIIQENKNDIFNPFETTKENSGGTGIGLWITKKLISKIDGNIYINEDNKDETEIVIELIATERD